MKPQSDMPPGPKRFPRLQAFAFRRDPLAFLTKLAQRYGDISHFRVGPHDFFLLNQPEYVHSVLVTNDRKFGKGLKLQRAKYLLGEGLLTSEGELHRRQRSLIQPVFNRQRLAANTRLMADSATKFADNWRDSETRNILHDMRRLTFAIMARTLFGSAVHAGEWDVSEELRLAVDRLSPYGDRPNWISAWLRKLNRGDSNNFKEARAKLDAITYHLINESKLRTTDEGDILSALLRACDSAGSMTDLQLRDELTTLVEAGHITLANAITWCWYLLACHPEAEAKLHRELDAVLDKRPPTFEDVARLRYTEMVFLEAMRLYPPAFMLGRRVLEDFSIGGYKLPVGSFIMMSPYIIQRDSRYYKLPNRFDPERWTPEARQNRPQFSYFPFGGGPRRCIGEGTAILEGVILLATLARRWRLRLPRLRLPKPLPLFTLVPSSTLMTLERRD